MNRHASKYPHHNLMKLLKGRQKARQHTHNLTEAQHLRQSIKALCDAIESGANGIKQENAADPYLNPEKPRINDLCTDLLNAAKGARTHCLEPSTKAWPHRIKIIGGR